MVNTDDLIEELAELDLTPQQAKVIAFSFSERRIEDACRKAGVSRTTHWRWATRDPIFKRGLEIARKEFLKQVAIEVRSGWIEARKQWFEGLIARSRGRTPTPHSQ